MSCAVIVAQPRLTSVPLRDESPQQSSAICCEHRNGTGSARFPVPSRAALGAGGRRFKSGHPDHYSERGRDRRRCSSAVLARCPTSSDVLAAMSEGDLARDGWEFDQGLGKALEGARAAPKGGGRTKQSSASRFLAEPPRPRPSTGDRCPLERKVQVGGRRTREPCGSRRGFEPATGCGAVRHASTE
jgi:hypothetical protein